MDYKYKDVYYAPKAQSSHMGTTILSYVINILIYNNNNNNCSGLIKY
jgi:hypothetical protein